MYCHNYDSSSKCCTWCTNMCLMIVNKTLIARICLPHIVLIHYNISYVLPMKLIWPLFYCTNILQSSSHILFAFVLDQWKCEIATLCCGRFISRCYLHSCFVFLTLIKIRFMLIMCQKYSQVRDICQCWKCAVSNVN